jgi:uncharacterized membrane protein YdjX (TVP38/TMEM64 family)
VATQPTTPSSEAPSASRKRRLLLWFGVGAALVAIALLWSLLPVATWLEALRGWIVGLGFRGIAVFALIYILGAVVLAPEAVLTILAGFAFGFWGLPIVVVAATIGAAAAFLIARYLARDRVRAAIERRPNFAAIDKAVAEDGWKIVGLLRLSPLVPFNLQNYLFGATGVPFLHFVAATFFGIIPGTALYIYFGVLGSAAGKASSVKWIFFAAGLVATVAVAVLIARKARQRLRETGLGEQAG